MVNFAVDNYFNGGSGAITSNVIDTTAITTNAYPALYQKARSGGLFSYTFPALTIGQYYALNLHFAEFSFTLAGQRQFNVAVNGVTYLTNFDIIAEAGAANKAIVKSFMVRPNSSGQIVVSFTAGAAQIPQVSGLEVVALGPVSSGALSPSASVIYQINSGGNAAGSFRADQYFIGGTTGSNTNAIDTSAANNPAPTAVYQSGRAGPFSYTLPGLIVNQIYTVRLHFAESTPLSPGQRQFNVAINNLQVLKNFDIVAAAGAINRTVVKRTVVKAFAAAADSSGQISIIFSTGAVSTPKLSALELISGYRVNAGGLGASFWEADQYYNGGGISQLSPVTTDISAAIDPAPAVVYQATRYGFVNYTFPKLAAGFSYGIRLHFAEVIYTYTSIGQRQFNVAINGTPVLTNYDILGNAGAMDQANIQTFSAMADSAGKIVVAFTAGLVDGPILSGIELVGGSGGAVGPGQ